MGKAIEVILLDDVKNLGRSGDTCKVKAGYARNFLFPQKMATVLTPGTKRLVEKKKAEAAARLAQEKKAAEELLKKLEASPLSIKAKANKDGRLFGSVDAAVLAAKLAEKGIELDRHAIVLDEPIKTVGEFTAALHLHAEVRGHLKVFVEPEKEAGAAE